MVDEATGADDPFAEAEGMSHRLHAARTRVAAELRHRSVHRRARAVALSGSVALVGLLGAEAVVRADAPATPARSASAPPALEQGAAVVSASDRELAAVAAVLARDRLAIAALSRVAASVASVPPAAPPAPPSSAGGSAAAAAGVSVPALPALPALPPLPAVSAAPSAPSVQATTGASRVP